MSPVPLYLCISLSLLTLVRLSLYFIKYTAFRVRRPNAPSTQEPTRELNRLHFNLSEGIPSFLNTRSCPVCSRVWDLCFCTDEQRPSRSRIQVRVQRRLPRPCPLLPLFAMCTLEMDMLSLVFPFFAREVAYGLGQTKHLPYVFEQANTCRMYSNKRTPAVCTRTSEHLFRCRMYSNKRTGAVCTRTS